MGLTIRLFLALITGIILSGCANGVTTKAEIQDQLSSQSRKNSNYLDLAQYWDFHADKSMALGSGMGLAYLTVWERSGKAEITMGTGPYYGMIELIRLDERTTLIKTYAWGGFAEKINEWKTLIVNAPEK
jgi:hypothetical protein